MTFKREKRFIQSGTTAYLEFQLDPDIYKSDVNAALGIVSTQPTGAGIELVPYTLKLARRSTATAFITMRMQRAVGAETEVRRIQFVCDKAAADTAKAALVGKTVNIGPSNSAWTLAA